MKKDDNKIEFRLIRITNEQFAIFEENFVSAEKIKIKTNLRYGVDETDKLISCFLDVVYECDSKPFLKIEAGCHFILSDKSWAELSSDDAINLPKDFVRHLAVLTVGTVRGILHTKTEGTDFNKYLLPTINLTNIIKDDAILKFE